VGGVGGGTIGVGGVGVGVGGVGGAIGGVIGGAIGGVIGGAIGGVGGAIAVLTIGCAAFINSSEEDIIPPIFESLFLAGRLLLF
tara:strand:+ start:16846 stop:17097 length:252 start_codon:yes stop_codon:yes gene_type:complete